MAAPGRDGSWLAKAWLLGALSALAASAPARAEEPRDVFYRLGPVELRGDTASYADFGAGVFDLFGENDGRTSASMRSWPTATSS